MKKRIVSAALSACLTLSLLTGAAWGYDLFYGIPSDKAEALKWPSSGIGSYIPNPWVAALPNPTASKNYLLASEQSQEGGKLQSTFTFSYDGQDRLVERHWNSKVSRFAYSSAGDLVSANLGDGADTVYTYDAAGNLTQIGNRQTFTYDAAGRVLTEDYHSENISILWTYTYNEHGGLISVSSVQPNGNNSTYTYDGAGHQLRYVTVNYGETSTNTYTWNSAGRLVRAASQSDYSTEVNTLSYDAAGNCTYRLEQQSNLSGGKVVSTTSKAEAYTYNAAGRLTCVATTYKSANHSDTYKTYLTYDSAGRLTHDSAGDGSGTYYFYDKAGNLVRKTYSNFGTPCTDTYTYVKRHTPLKASVSDFTDVKSGAYYYDAVKWAVEKEITNGTTATTFSPNKTCTQSQIITFLWRASGSPAASGTAAYTDSAITEKQYYYKALQWAAEKGVVTDMALDPSAACSRSDVALYLWRCAGSPGASSASFGDVPADAPYAAAVAWAVEKGVTKGTSDTTFSPDSTCTRGQIATFLYRDLGK
jgi:YD repeat-containing protein